MRIGQVIHGAHLSVSDFLFAKTDSVAGVFKKYMIHTYRNSDDEHYIALWKHVQPGGRIVEFLLDVRITSEDDSTVAATLHSIQDSNLPTRQASKTLTAHSTGTQRAWITNGKIGLKEYEHGQTLFTFTGEVRGELDEDEEGEDCEKDGATGEEESRSESEIEARKISPKQTPASISRFFTTTRSNTTLFSSDR
ncbi:hypothetical protein TrRE_jg6224 [Triparma retinervis]|uniref:Uncharacterized protein n=1 Tax=Triparma retinervis TaxID=2557542 RepID=A0A9W6Z8D3_9STRA|nr:hypothetical protein TrRE_jg6224 [Triparma retinervis]